jgi:hypothetical protein
VKRSPRLIPVAWDGAATPAATTQVTKMAIDRFMSIKPKVECGRPGSALCCVRARHGSGMHSNGNYVRILSDHVG